MKKAILLFVASVLFCSCSNNEDTSIDQSTASRPVGKAYPQFSVLFETLYGTNVSVDDKSVRREERGAKYIITKVYNAEGDRLRGYFEETEGVTVYYTENAAAKTITMYSLKSANSYISTVTDVSDDSVYIQHGVDINYTNVAQRVFGWGESYLSGDCINGKRYWLQNKRFLGIRVAVRNVLDANGENLYAPCE